MTKKVKGTRIFINGRLMFMEGLSERLKGIVKIKTLSHSFIVKFYGLVVF